MHPVSSIRNTIIRTRSATNSLNTRAHIVRANKGKTPSVGLGLMMLSVLGVDFKT